MNRKDEPRFLNLRNGGNMKDDRDTAYVTPIFLVLIALGGLGIYLNLGL